MNIKRKVILALITAPIAIAWGITLVTEFVPYKYNPTNVSVDKYIVIYSYHRKKKVVIHEVKFLSDFSNTLNNKTKRSRFNSDKIFLKDKYRVKFHLQDGSTGRFDIGHSTGSDWIITTESRLLGSNMGNSGFIKRYENRELGKLIMAKAKEVFE